MLPTTAYRLPPTAYRRPGFTLLELMVAMLITVILGLAVIFAYNSSMQAFYRTEKNLNALAAFRSAADRMEREVNSMVFKSSVWEHPDYLSPAFDHGCSGGGYNGGGFMAGEWMTRAKFLHGEPMNPSLLPTAADSWSIPADPTQNKTLYRINFRPRYMGYYSTLDGFTIDRSEWYFNPPEEKRLWNNGLDDDEDDPEDGLQNLYDDKGSLMFRKKLDYQMVWREWDRAAGSPNNYRDSFYGPYSRASFPPLSDELAGPLSVDDLIKTTVKDMWGTDVTVPTSEVLSPDIKDPTKYPDAASRKAYLLSKGFIVDTGTVVGEGFSDLSFSYLYKTKASGDKFVYAKWWPWDNDRDPHSSNTLEPLMTTPTASGGMAKSLTIVGPGSSVAWRACPWCGKTGWSAWPVLPVNGYDFTYTGNPDKLANTVANRTFNFDGSYFTLPLAVSARFTFTMGRQSHTYEKLIYLHASRWLMYLNP